MELKQNLQGMLSNIMFVHMLYVYFTSMLVASIYLCFCQCPSFFLFYLCVYVRLYLKVDTDRQFTPGTQSLPKGEQNNGDDSDTKTKRIKESYILCRLSKKLMDLCGQAYNDGWVLKCGALKIPSLIIEFVPI